ncbi:hypothetical protein [Streptomyces sp. AM 2-1-1]|uniref:hypothetical protein n=1 Tax=Streptomyces sp. AM 2-1-1 TaxID=3028709 RepID=UPI0023B90865|nr:hypothetical protein [Streptomyces sp. AM 2-1-1]WEH41115.1 hypothetical protein PZB77_17320 [Streptomyces sp. AM 2-1-1]
MSVRRAEVGDIVEDAEGRQAIVTDIRRGATWVLRPRRGPATVQWDTSDPDSLRVVKSRASRLAEEHDLW